MKYCLYCKEEITKGKFHDIPLQSSEIFSAPAPRAALNKISQTPFSKNVTCLTLNFNLDPDNKIIVLNFPKD